MFLFLSNSFNLCTRLFDISKFNTLSGIGDSSEIWELKFSGESTRNVKTEYFSPIFQPGQYLRKYNPYSSIISLISLINWTYLITCRIQYFKWLIFLVYDFWYFKKINWFLRQNFNLILTLILNLFPQNILCDLKTNWFFINIIATNIECLISHFNSKNWKY